MIDLMIERLVESYADKIMDELSPMSWEATDDDDLRRNTHRLLYQFIIDMKLKEANMLMNYRKDNVDLRA